jgi:hypothetical protein
VALLLGVSTPSRAEVGVFVDDVGGPSTVGGPYILGTIIDDPDPFSIIWRQFGPSASGRAVLNPEGEANLDGLPSILRNPVSGLAMVAWARNSAQGYDVVVSHFDGSSWTVPTVVAASIHDDLDPQLALDPSNGDVHLFHWVDETTPRVMHSVAPADLSSWSTPVQVSQAGEDACRPHGTFHDGDLYVAYEVHDYGFEQTPRQVVLSKRVAGVFEPEVVAITHRQGEVRPQIHGHASQVWIDWIDSDDEAAWTRKDGTGQWEPMRYEPYGSVEERDYHVRGAIRTLATQ